MKACGVRSGANRPIPSPTSPARSIAGRAGKPLDMSPTRLAEVKASAASFAAKPRSDIAIGQRVFHSKFGYGLVTEIEGNKLEIDFEHAGRKRVLDSFVQPA